MCVCVCSMPKEYCGLAEEFDNDNGRAELIKLVEHHNEKKKLFKFCGIYDN